MSEPARRLAIRLRTVPEYGDWDDGARLCDAGEVVEGFPQFPEMLYYNVYSTPSSGGTT